MDTRMPPTPAAAGLRHLLVEDELLDRRVAV